ncbi:cytochrome C oxidase subunit IV family protein [Litoribrevibacter euphylliae]|uniref:Cytochrome C oxidase subunit IV family protein n=1 Tax=Litoribrevibacter euphylliae TaxID=1834034 RepID=A0ABV7HCF2_9GAMM
MSDLEKVSQVKKVTYVWLFLMVATLIAAAIGSAGHSGVVGALVALGLLIAKGQLVVDHFMELRHVDWHWRLLLSAYSVVISGLVFTAYWMSVQS